MRAARAFNTPTPSPARARFTTDCGCSDCQASGISSPQALSAPPVSGSTAAPGRAIAISGCSVRPCGSSGSRTWSSTGRSGWPGGTTATKCSVHRCTLSRSSEGGSEASEWIAMWKRPAAMPETRSGVVCSVSWTRSCGCSAWTAASTPGRNPALTLGWQPMTTRPRSVPECSSTASAPRSSAASTSRAWGRKALPSSVGRTGRWLRSTRIPPRARSRAATWVLTRDCARCRARAAAEKLPWSTTATKVSSQSVCSMRGTGVLSGRVRAGHDLISRPRELSSSAQVSRPL